MVVEPSQFGAAGQFGEDPYAQYEPRIADFLREWDQLYGPTDAAGMAERLSEAQRNMQGLNDAQYHQSGQANRDAERAAGAAKAPDDQYAPWQQFMNSPEFQQLVKSPQFAQYYEQAKTARDKVGGGNIGGDTGAGSDLALTGALKAAAKDMGMTIPELPKDHVIDIRNGESGPEIGLRKSDGFPWKTALLMAGGLAGAFILPAVLGAGAATGATGTVDGLSGALTGTSAVGGGLGPAAAASATGLGSGLIAPTAAATTAATTLGGGLGAAAASQAKNIPGLGSDPSGGGFDYGSILESMGGVSGLIGMGTNIAGGVMASNAANDAARIQAESADKAMALQKQQYDQTRADLDPYRQVGQQGLGAVQNMQPLQQPTTYTPGQFNAPAAYQAPQFQAPDAYQAPEFKAPAAYQAPEFNAPAAFKAPTLEEARNAPGMQLPGLESASKAIERSAAARGQTFNTNTMTRLAEENQKIADQGYYNLYDRSYQQSNDDYTKARGSFESDRSFGYGASQDQYNQARGAFESDRNFGYGASQDRYNQARGSFESDRNFGYGVSSDNYDRQYGQFSDNEARQSNAFNDNFNRTRTSYLDELGRQMNLADLGYRASTGLASAGTNYANATGELLGSQANAQAAGRIGSSNAVTGAMGDVANNLTLQELLKRYGIKA